MIRLAKNRKKKVPFEQKVLLKNQLREASPVHGSSSSDPHAHGRVQGTDM